MAKYDVIGLNYAELRKPDPRIGAAIQQALGDARTVLNVGAGTGSYEPVDRLVTAVFCVLGDRRRRIGIGQIEAGSRNGRMGAALR